MKPPLEALFGILIALTLISGAGTLISIIAVVITWGDDDYSRLAQKTLKGFGFCAGYFLFLLLLLLLVNS